MNATSWKYNYDMWHVTPTEAQTIMGWWVDCSGDELMTDYATIISTLKTSYAARLSGLDTAITGL